MTFMLFSSGKLVYKATKKGDRIIDFSHAGYKGGGVTLPYVPAKLTVHPLGENEDCIRINPLDFTSWFLPHNGQGKKKT